MSTGRQEKANTATDPAPLSMMETVVVLKDQREWRKMDRWYSDLPEFLHWPFEWISPSYMSWDELIRDMNKKMSFPGVTNAWTLPIKGRIDMLTTGIRTPIGIKISGGDLKKLNRSVCRLKRSLVKLMELAAYLQKGLLVDSFLTSILTVKL